MFPFIVPSHDKVLLKIGRGTAPNSTFAPHFDIFIWNVYKGQKATLFEKDFTGLCKGKDFIFLQEAIVNREMPRIWKEDFPGYEWHLAQSFHYKKDLTSTGVAIGSTWSPEEVDFIRLKAREFFWFTPKLTLFSEYKINNTKILMVCTHVLNFVTQQAFTNSLYEIAAKIADFKGPVVLAGDFNTWNFKRFLVMKNIFRDLKLDHVDLEDDGRLLKLDHVFIRGFDVLRSQVHHSIISSDHYPIEIRLKLF